MKKSLILSIVMTLVLVISMSTATFAWYTSNSSVQANVNTVTAATASGNLKLTLTPANPTANETVANNAYTADPDLLPAAPIITDSKITSWVSCTLGETAAENTWSTISSLSSYVESGTILVSDDSNTTEAIDIIIELSAADDDFCVIITGSDGTILANTDYTPATGTEGNYADGVKVDASATASDVEFTCSGTTFNYYIWFNGATTLNTDAGSQFSVTFTFAIAE